MDLELFWIRVGKLTILARLYVSNKALSMM